MSRLSSPKIVWLFSALMLVALAGCGSDSAPGYDSASMDAAEALAKNNNDITKLTPSQRAALEKAANAGRPGGGSITSTNGGDGTPPPPR